MKAGVPAVVVAFALSNLYLLSITGPLVSPQHELVFHLPGSAALLFLPAIFDILLISAVLTVALWLVRPHPRAELILWSALLLALPSGLLTTIYGFQSRKVPLGFGWPVASLAASLFLYSNLRPQRSLRLFHRVRHRISLLLGFLALPGLLLFLQLFVYGWQARHLNPPFVPAPSRAATARTAPGPRIVWIILDELSFDQLYGHRYPGLQLPNFDALAAQSVLFTHAASAAEYTRQAIPSMLTGLPLSGTQPGADGQTVTLSVRGTHQKLLFNPTDTVFGDAQRGGLQTAVAGWYEPYCRLLPGVLNRCYWIYSDELPGGLTTSGTLLQHTVEPFVHFLRLTFRPAGIGPVMPTFGALDVHRHRSDYGSLLTASDSLLVAGQPGLVLIHMPIPHPWGFYDRRTGTFPNHRTSYLDNLALADAYIGRVRSQLERAGVWDSTNLLVTGDHSWRTASVWANSAHWSAEEQAASHGGAWDDRPAVILKLSGERAPATVDARFDAVRTRALLDELIAGRVATTSQLAGWVSGSASPGLGGASQNATAAPGTLAKTIP